MLITSCALVTAITHDHLSQNFISSFPINQKNHHQETIPSTHLTFWTQRALAEPNNLARNAHQKIIQRALRLNSKQVRNSHAFTIPQLNDHKKQSASTRIDFFACWNIPNTKTNNTNTVYTYNKNNVIKRITIFKAENKTKIWRQKNNAKNVKMRFWTFK